jgi:hypothetical protein
LLCYLATVGGDNEIGDDKNEGKLLAISIAMAVQWYDAGRIAPPAAAMFNEFVETTQNTNKTQLLPSNYGTFRALIFSENFIPPNGPSTQVIDATSFV